jgi:peroxiredoxin
LVGPARTNLPEVGETAPDFTLYDTETKETRLSDYLGKGKPVILAFFPGAFTGTCTKELCTFRDMFDLATLDAQLVAISVDSPFANKGFAVKNGFRFPLLSDFGKEIIQKYGVVWKNLSGLNGYVSANRAIFVLDPKGKIKMKWIAPNPGVLPNFDEVKKAVA